MARSGTSKFDASEAMTNKLIHIIERGVLPRRNPWTAGGSAHPLRQNSQPYHGMNNFLVTMRTVIAGYTFLFRLTVPQANILEARIGRANARLSLFTMARVECSRMIARMPTMALPMKPAVFRSTNYTARSTRIRSRTFRRHSTRLSVRSPVTHRPRQSRTCRRSLMPSILLRSLV